MTAIPVLKEFHSFVAYIFLLSTIVLMIFSISRNVRKAKFSGTQLILARISFITSHVQLLIGLLLWWFHGYPQMMSDDIKSVMTDKLTRQLAIEHPLTNIIAITLITIGFVSLKKTYTDSAKHVKVLIFFGIGLVLILSRIPYSLWINN